MLFHISIKWVNSLCIPERRAVVGQDNELSFSLTDHLLGLFVAQHVLSTLHHQLETGVDGLHGLFLNKHRCTYLKLVTTTPNRKTTMGIITFRTSNMLVNWYKLLAHFSYHIYVDKLALTLAALPVLTLLILADKQTNGRQ